MNTVLKKPGRWEHSSSNRHMRAAEYREEAYKAAINAIKNGLSSTDTVITLRAEYQRIHQEEMNND